MVYIKDKILSYKLDEDTVALIPGIIISIMLTIYCYL